VHATAALLLSAPHSTKENVMEWTELKTAPADALLAKARAELARQAAAGYLARAGLRILARGWRCTAGTIDLLAAEQRVLVVCQVKVRAGRGRRRRPLEAITRHQARKLRRLAIRWITDNGLLFEEIRIDVVGLTPDQATSGGFTIEHVRGVA
jgi:putative endonuclease